MIWRHQPEDISAPRCFTIEDELRKALDIPVFHDDQHGTAVVVLAGLINALKVVRKTMSGIKVVVSGVGAAGVACTRSSWLPACGTSSAAIGPALCTAGAGR